MSSSDGRGPRLAGLCSAIVFTAALLGCSSDGASARATAVIYGDSLMAEARQVIRAEAARVQDWNVVVRAKSGFAPGGWIAQLRRDVRRLHPKLIAEKTAELATRYDQLAGFVTPGGPYAMGNALTLADCVLFPLFFFATKLHPMLGDKDPTASRPALAKWWEAVQKHPAVAKVNAELAKALAEQLG